MVVIEKLSDVFSKVASNMHQPLDPPQKQTLTKSAPYPSQSVSNTGQTYSLGTSQHHKRL